MSDSNPETQKEHKDPKRPRGSRVPEVRKDQRGDRGESCREKKEDRYHVGLGYGQRGERRFSGMPLISAEQRDEFNRQVDIEADKVKKEVHKQLSKNGKRTPPPNYFRAEAERRVVLKFVRKLRPKVEITLRPAAEGSATATPATTPPATETPPVPPPGPGPDPTDPDLALCPPIPMSGYIFRDGYMWCVFPCTPLAPDVCWDTDRWVLELPIDCAGDGIIDYYLDIWIEMDFWSMVANVQYSELS